MISAPALPVRADEIYRSGPETLVKSAAAIVEGLVSEYAKQVTKSSEPGPEQIPLRWTVSARIDAPNALKGKVPAGPLSVSRAEASPELPEPSMLYWEANYGELSPQGRAVVFLGAGSTPPVLKAVSSGAGEQDLIGLVKDVVAIQALESPGERQKKWLAYLDGSPTDEGRRVALRSLVAVPAAWPDLEPTLGRSLRNPNRSVPVRAFAFGIVAHAITEGKWPDQDKAVVGFLCAAFSTEAQPQLATQELLALGQVVNFCSRDEHRHERKALRDLVVKSVQERPSLALVGVTQVRPDMEDTYQALRARILAP